MSMSFELRKCPFCNKYLTLYTKETKWGVSESDLNRGYESIYCENEYCVLHDRIIPPFIILKLIDGKKAQEALDIACKGLNRIVNKEGQCNRAADCRVMANETLLSIKRITEPKKE